MVTTREAPPNAAGLLPFVVERYSYWRSTADRSVTLRARRASVEDVARLAR